MNDTEQRALEKRWIEVLREFVSRKGVKFLKAHGWNTDMWPVSFGDCMKHWIKRVRLGANVERRCENR